ncbi:MAG: hypothetical protein HZB29_13505 [Nitrospinae bacterium]|nr:hypothetical protein [Nitrospinota bacterium]
MTGKTDLPIGKAIESAMKIVRDETILIRVDRARKSELEKRAKRAGVSLSSYILLAEDKFAHIGEK